MVAFVSEISAYAKAKKPGFLIIPQNGESLASEPGYLEVVDGIGREDLSFGYQKDGKPTPEEEKNLMVSYLDMFVAQGKKVLTVDYVFSNSEDVPDYADATDRIHTAYTFSSGKGYIPYATVRNLNYPCTNPSFEPNVDNISSFTEVTEFLYYLQPAEEVSREQYISSIRTTNYDCVVMDYSYDGSAEFTNAEITSIREGLNSGNGGFAIAYMSIGEAEDYRFYWEDKWTSKTGRIKREAPDWLYRENPQWKGNFQVLYWKQAWKNIVFTYLDKIIAQGFDGVYLDIIDAFEVYESILE